MLASGIYRVQIEELKPEDYLPTDSRSNFERAIAMSFDKKTPFDTWRTPVVMFRSKENGGAELHYVNNTHAPHRPSRSLKAHDAFAKHQPHPMVQIPNFIDDLILDGEEDWRRHSLVPWTLPRNNRLTKRTTFRAFRRQNCRTNSVLVVAKHNWTDPTGARFNLLNRTLLNEIRKVESLIFNIKARAGKRKVYYEETPNRTGICTRGRGGGCSGFNLKTMSSFVLTNDDDPLHLLLDPDSQVALTYPNYFLLDLSSFLGIFFFEIFNFLIKVFL